MANVLFAGDLHLGHKNIHTFRKEVSSEEDNRTTIFKHWGERVTKRDIVYLMGDVIFDEQYWEDFKALPGKKILVRGNHDNFKTHTYLEGFEEIYGIHRYKEFWLTHAPIHPEELRGKKNIHGHVHYATLPDNRYINTSVEALWRAGYKSLISLDEVRRLG